MASFRSLVRALLGDAYYAAYAAESREEFLARLDQYAYEIERLVNRHWTRLVDAAPVPEPEDEAPVHEPVQTSDPRTEGDPPFRPEGTVPSPVRWERVYGDAD